MPTGSLNIGHCEQNRLLTKAFAWLFNGEDLCVAVSFCLVAFSILSNIFRHGLCFQRKAVNRTGIICLFENVLLCLSREFHSDFNIKICIYINDCCFDTYAALICGFYKDIFFKYVNRDIFVIRHLEIGTTVIFRKLFSSRLHGLFA